jgi:hypothetical protein
LSFKPKFLTTGIGSMPFTDPDYAIKLILETFHDIPFWPQLPKIGLNEQMEIQYSEGLPAVEIDIEKSRMFFNTAGDTSDALAEFYEQYMVIMDPDEGSGDCTPFAITPNHSQGIYAFENKLKQEANKKPFIKVQTTGPCSFALTIVDENKRAIYYNEEFRDVIVKAMAMKSRWQIQKFQPYAEKIICFIDEPILSAFGSSTYITVQRDDIVASLAEVVEAIHGDDAIAGCHCCGNTDWSILVDAGVDMISFDAYEYGETIAIYANSIKGFLEKGGLIAWGVIPTMKTINSVTAEQLTDHLEKTIEHLASKGIDKQLIAEQSLITPSCGTGSMNIEEAKKVFEIINDVSGLMKEKYGF